MSGRTTICLALLLSILSWAAGAEPRRLLLVAGPPSHPWGCHEHLASFQLAKEWIEAYATGVEVTVSDGWPADPQLVERADAIIINSDGAKGDLAAAHASELDQLAARGGGIGILHWTLDIQDPVTRRRALDWIGGYFETGWSANPEWTAKVARMPDHPVTHGVKPFTIRDEWYFHMRFVDGMKGVTPILCAAPPDSVRDKLDGPYSSNPAVRSAKGEEEIIAWVYERPGGGRGFGFTGLHYQWNWAHPDYRTFLLNAFVWLAGGQVPAGGVVSPAPDAERLMREIPKPRPAKREPAKMQRYIENWITNPPE